MSPRTRRISVACAALMALMLTAAPAFAGPPWISAEYPSNPHESSTRGAFFLVHTYHHGDAISSILTGTAEGIVNGRRQTVKLDIVDTGKPGVYAVRYQPASQGVWVLAINMGSGEGAAGLLATIGRNGELSSVRVPISGTREGGRWLIPRAVNAQDVTAALQAQMALIEGTSPDLGMSTSGGALVAAGIGLVIGVPLIRRRALARESARNR